jgi:mannose-6-phosphate isomerase-like protein (cupin superfamily)
MPFGHRHREQEDAYVVVAGSGRAKLDDEVVARRGESSPAVRASTWSS